MYLMRNKESSVPVKFFFFLALSSIELAKTEAGRTRIGSARHNHNHFPKVEDFKPPEGYQPVKGFETVVGNTNKPPVGPTVDDPSKTYSTAHSSVPSTKYSSAAPSTSYTSPQWYNYYQNNQALSSSSYQKSSSYAPSSSSPPSYNNNNNNNYNQNNQPSYYYQYSNPAPAYPPSSSSSSSNRNPFYVNYNQYQSPSPYYQPPVYYPPPPNYYPPPPPSYQYANPSDNNNNDAWSATTQSPYRHTNSPQHTTSSNKFNFPLLPTIRNPSASQNSNGEPNWRRTPPPNLIRPVDFWKETPNEHQQQQPHRPSAVSTLPPPPPPTQAPPQYSTFKPPPSDSTTVDWKQVYQESKNKENDRWNLGSHASNGVDDNCMKCLCFIESWCSDVGCVWDQGSLSCGWYQLKYEYWIDCGQPGGGWKECANSKSCAEGCVKRYLGRYSSFCTIGSSCPDLARIHNGGPYGCSSNSTEYYGWLISRCLKREAPYENIDTFPIPNS